MTTNLIKGILFALTAAALNATIGVLSKVLINSGFTPNSIAVIKTILGCLLLSLILIFIKHNIKQTSWNKAAICAFLGIFILFYFETAAYQHYSAAGVVVILMASASASAIILGRIVLKDPITANATVGFIFTIAGIMMILNADLQKEFSLQGSFLAAIAGCGYGAFSVTMKKMHITGGMQFTRQILFFGSLYLLIPSVTGDFAIGELSVLVISSLLALVILPTVLGFFCTTRAIEHLRPSQLQALELTEPLFAALLSFLILNEVPQESLYMGAGLIITGLLFSNDIIHINWTENNEG